MSDKIKLPKELRVDKKQKREKIYEKTVYTARFGKRKSLLGPTITFIAFTVVFLIIFKGPIEIAIIIIAIVFFSLFARWFFGR